MWFPSYRFDNASQAHIHRFQSPRLPLPKPISTASKTPASTATASKAPAKTTAKVVKPTTAPKCMPEEGEETKKKRRRVRKETYSSYIYEGERYHLAITSRSDPLSSVLQRVCHTGISNKAMAILNSFVNDIFEHIATEASSSCSCLERFEVVLTITGNNSELAAYSKKSTSSRKIQTSVRLILPGELAKHTISEGTVTGVTPPIYFAVHCTLSLVYCPGHRL